MSWHWTIWAICLPATVGVILRPWRLPEAIWAVVGAFLLVVGGLIPVTAALEAITRGADVYFFLAGMMMLSEAARAEGLFDWIAASTVNHAAGSSARLFTFVFITGIIVTAFLSNDATAVVLTPAVYAVARRAEAEPLPMLFACALIANAASFILPISNPANLVLYGGHTPPLGTWLASFALPSAAAIIVTFALLRLIERRQLAVPCHAIVTQPPLSNGARAAAIGIGGTAILLICLSAWDMPLGLPTCAAGAATALLACLVSRRSLFRLLRCLSWSILPLVAGLFIMVEAVNQTGATRILADILARSASASLPATAATAGAILAFVCNMLNNLPAGLIAATAIDQAHAPRLVIDSLLIGVDLGPNLSVTGSLATILWLAVIRREGQNVGFWRFLKIGVAVMPPALAAALATRLVIG